MYVHKSQINSYVFTIIFTIYVNAPLLSCDGILLVSDEPLDLVCCSVVNEEILFVTMYENICHDVGGLPEIEPPCELKPEEETLERSWPVEKGLGFVPAEENYADFIQA